MKKISTNNIAPGKGQPFGKRSLEHLQQGLQEVIAAIVEAVNRGRKQVVYLTGCTIASTASQHSNQAGWAFYNGEVFQVNAGVVNSPGQPVWVVEEIFENGGAVPFSNMEFHDILAIRRLKLAAPGTAGGVALTNAEAFGSLLSTMHSHEMSHITGLQEAINSLTNALNTKANANDLSTFQDAVNGDLDTLEQVLANKANKGQNEWINLTLINGAIYNVDTNSTPPSYMVDDHKCVHFRGSVLVPRNGIVSFAQLPIELTPSRNRMFYGLVSGSNTAKAALPIGIIPSETLLDPNIQVKMNLFADCDYSSGNYQSFKLDGFKYFVN